MASSFFTNTRDSSVARREQDIEEMKLDGEEFLIMREDEVRAVVETG